MRVVFFYNSWKHGFGSRTPWSPQDKSKNYYASRFKEEGYYLLLKQLTYFKIIDRAVVFIESRNEPGYFDCQPLDGFVVPSIEDAEAFLRPGDIIFVRGGWKHWHDVLTKWQSMGHWLMVYAANTGRQKWEFWDLVLSDLDEKKHKDPAGRVFFPFRKPINEDIFYRSKIPYEPRYDLMIGASRIHDKKGQWRAIKALVAYKRIFGENLKCILPGPWARGVETNSIKKKVKDAGLDVNMPGALSREDLAIAMNESRGFVHFGAHGQGDRGPMEAMACGCPVMIGFPQYHAPWLTRMKKFSTVARDVDDVDKTAIEMRQFVRETVPEWRKEAADWRFKNAGLTERVLPDLRDLFNAFRLSPERKKGLLEAYLL